MARLGGSLSTRGFRCGGFDVVKQDARLAHQPHMPLQLNILAFILHHAIVGGNPETLPPFLPELQFHVFEFGTLLVTENLGAVGGELPCLAARILVNELEILYFDIDARFQWLQVHLPDRRAEFAEILIGGK